MTADHTPGPKSQNRFARHRKKTVLAVSVAMLLTIELCAYLVVVATGHSALRYRYPYNRIVSGYTVFRNTPDFDTRSSTIKTDPQQPDVRFDAQGFIAADSVRLEKTDDTLRIFVVGGSTAIGAGQNQRYHAVHSYPDGIYSYPDSIAGRLQVFLEQKLPGRKIEVVTAATYRRRFHQSVMHYMESLSRYAPDYVVNIDGQNDVPSFASGTPFADVEGQMLPAQIALLDEPSWLNHLSTYYVLSKAWDRLQVQRTATMALPDAASPPLRSDYQSRRERYVRHAQRFLQIVDHYLAVLKSDQTQCVFVLQPLLYRQSVDSTLTDRERRLAEVPLPDEEWLILRYFFDDYLSDALRKRLERQGAIYIDMGQSVADRAASTETFTDYCHLTVDGNQFVGETIGRAIVQDLQTRLQPRVGNANVRDESDSRMLRFAGVRFAGSDHVANPIKLE